MEILLQYLKALSLPHALDFLGTFAFAVSGIRLASAKNFDWFGAYVVGLVTAIGGGTIRDLLLGVQPFWMHDPRYLIVTGAALILMLIFGRIFIRLGTALFIFDAIGLGFFTISGIDKSLGMEMPVWVCIMMGVISGTAGGIIRDVLINEVPLIFRKELYALAGLLGGVVYFMARHFDFLEYYYEIIAVVVVTGSRLLAVKYRLRLPKVKI